MVPDDMSEDLRRMAIDQAEILAKYLRQTPSGMLDLDFVGAHASAASDFARQAKAFADAAQPSASDE